MALSAVCVARCQRNRWGNTADRAATCKSLTGLLPLLLFAKFMQMEWSQSETECPIMGDLSLTSLTCVGSNRCCAVVLVLPAACIPPPHGTLASTAADAALPQVTAGWQRVSCARNAWVYCSWPCSIRQPNLHLTPTTTQA